MAILKKTAKEKSNMWVKEKGGCQFLKFAESHSLLIRKIFSYLKGKSSPGFTFREVLNFESICLKVNNVS